MFINSLRTGAFVVALSIATFRWSWPIFAYVFLLTFLFLAVLLREYPNTSRRTLTVGTIVFCFVGFSRFSALLPVSRTPLFFWGYTGLLVLFYLIATLIYRTRGRVGYYPFFPATIGLLLGLTALSFLARWQDMARFASLVNLGQTIVLGMLISGVVVGGVLAGVTKPLPLLHPTCIQTPLLREWHPHRPPLRATATHGPVAFRSLQRSLSRLVYRAANSVVAIAAQIVNSGIRILNTSMANLCSLINAVATLARRFYRRILSIVVETVYVVRDGLYVAANVIPSYIRYMAIPFSLLLTAAISVVYFSESVVAYVGTGVLTLMLNMTLSLLVLLGSIIGIVASQSNSSVRCTGDAVLKGLVVPTTGGTVFFILLSIGLSFSDRIISPNPYSIGPLTIGACLLVVAGVAYYFLNSGRGEAQPGDSSDETMTQIHSGGVVPVTKTLLASLLVAVILAVGGLVPGLAAARPTTSPVATRVTRVVTKAGASPAVQAAKRNRMPETNGTYIQLYVDPAGKGVTLWARPSRRSARVMQIPAGTRLQALRKPIVASDGKNWYQIEYGRKQGYIPVGELPQRDLTPRRR
jgi:hypothetical protein